MFVQKVSASFQLFLVQTGYELQMLLGSGQGFVNGLNAACSGTVEKHPGAEGFTFR
jgi:hypothetical protein